MVTGMGVQEEEGQNILGEVEDPSLPTHQIVLMALGCVFSQKVSKEEFNIHSNRPMMNSFATRVQGMFQHHTVALRHLQGKPHQSNSLIRSQAKTVPICYLVGLWLPDEATTVDRPPINCASFARSNKATHNTYLQPGSPHLNVPPFRQHNANS